MAFVGSLSGSGGASNTINVTGSIIIANPGTGGLFPSFPGTDAVFFVSGAIDGKAAGSRTVSVFGGDTVVSGSLTIGTGSIRIDSNEIRFQGGAAKITSGSGGLTFFDSGTPSGVTLTTLAAGAGGGDVDGPSDSIDNSIARFDGTTGKLLTGSAITISDETGGGIAIAGSATATTISLFNTAATTVNFAGDATALAIGGGAGGTTTTIKGGALVGNTTTQAVFNTTATTVNFAQAATTITAGASGGSTTFQGNLTGSNVLASALTVTNGATFGDGFGSTGTSISADGNISTDGNVIVGGDLTVNGTTTTINTQNLLVEDPVILMASGAAGPNRDGGIAIFSGSADTTGPGARTELVFGRVANDTWGAGKINTANGTVTDLTGMSLLPVRASKFELGGATAFVTSSDGTNITMSGSQTTIGANNRLVILEAAGVPFLTASSNAGLNAVSLTPGAGFTTANIAHDVATTVNFAANASLEIARTVNLGTGPASGAAAQTVNIGSTNTTSALTLRAGTGATTHTAGGIYDVNAAGAITIDSSGGTIGIGADAVAQAINVGTGAAARTITIGNATGATSVVLNAGTGNIDIGAGAQARIVNLGTGLAAQSVTVGSADSSSALSLKAGTGKINVFQDVLPNTDNAIDLGSPTKRFRNMFTGDLHLKNDRGDWTVIEEEDYLSITNNKSGKRYKFVLQEI